MKTQSYMQTKNSNYVEGTILGVKDDSSLSCKHNFKEKKF